MINLSNLVFKQIAKRLILGSHPRDFLLEMLPENSIGMEIGVHLGDFSQEILEKVKPKELHLVDPWKYEKSDAYNKALYGGKRGINQNNMDKRYEKILNRFESEINDKKIIVHRTDSTVLNNFEDNYFDWIYIDGNHLYEYVKMDIELSHPKVKKNGYITGDDYHSFGWWKGGVTKAVDEFETKNLAKLIKIKSNQFIFQK